MLTSARSSRCHTTDTPHTVFLVAAVLISPTASASPQGSVMAPVLVRITAGEPMVVFPPATPGYACYPPSQQGLRPAATTDLTALVSHAAAIEMQLSHSRPRPNGTSPPAANQTNLQRPSYDIGAWDGH